MAACSAGARSRDGTSTPRWCGPGSRGPSSNTRNRYETIEAEARKAKVGIWKGEAEPAWVFRERRWVAAQPDAPQGCAIKGNVTANGHIYHMPWSPWYAKVRVDTAKSERWFCSETEAANAGFRPAKGH